MKFVALALTLLLAVGSQAASVQADAPSPADHINGVLQNAMTTLKDLSYRIIDRLDDAEYAEAKTNLKTKVNDVFGTLETRQSTGFQMLASIFSTISDATADFRQSLRDDMAELKPDADEINSVLERHMLEYWRLLEPTVMEWKQRREAEMEELRLKMEPIVRELGEKYLVNKEETKEKLLPFLEKVKQKGITYITMIKQAVWPYITEYLEQLSGFVATAQKTDVAAMQEKIAPHATVIFQKLQEIFTIVGSQE